MYLHAYARAPYRTSVRAHVTLVRYARGPSDNILSSVRSRRIRAPRKERRGSKKKKGGTKIEKTRRRGKSTDGERSKAERGVHQALQ